MQELENELLKYKKYVMLDESNYSRIVNGEVPLKKAETKII